MTGVTLSRNRLLAQLPRDIQDRLAPLVRTVPLRAGDLLFSARAPATAAYFPESGLVSLVSSVRSGETLDVGLVGSDGVLGASTLTGVDEMPCDGIIRVRGTALRIELDVLRQWAASDLLLSRLLYRHAYLTVATHVTSAACIAFHSTRERCARLLLLTSDLLVSDELPLTHDQLAHMLGVRRESVTVALGGLDARGFIEHRRAHIVVGDRQGLEAATCECYPLMRAELRRILE